MWTGYARIFPGAHRHRRSTLNRPDSKLDKHIQVKKGNDSFTKVGLKKKEEIYFRIHLRLAFLVVSCFLEILNSLTRENV